MPLTIKVDESGLHVVCAHCGERPPPAVDGYWAVNFVCPCEEDE